MRVIGIFGRNGYAAGMSSSLIGFLIVAGAGFIGLIIYVQHEAKKRRRGEYAAWTREHGFTYAPGTVEVASPSTQKPFSKRGKHENLMEGTYNGHQVRAYTHMYTTSSYNGTTTTTQTHRFAIAATPINTVGCYVDISSQGFFGRMADSMGFGVLTGDEEFDRAWKVRADDEAKALALLTPDFRAWIAADNRFSVYPLRIDNGWVQTWTDGYIDIADLPAKFDLICAVADRLPRQA
jgi:hypothetical protein